MRSGLGHEYEMPQSACPYCGHKLDTATGGSNAPTPGDFSVCLKCLGELRFDENLQVRKVTAAERREMHLVNRAEIDLFKRAIATIRAGKN